MFSNSGMLSNNFGISTFPKLKIARNTFASCSSLAAIDYTVWTMPALEDATYLFQSATPASTTGLSVFFSRCTSLKKAS